MESIKGPLNRQHHQRHGKKVSTKHSLNLFCEHYSFVSLVKPQSIEEALSDEFWVMAMHDELNQFKRNDVWELVPFNKIMNIIGTKWVFKNKLDEHGLTIRNKARLVAKVYNPEKGIDFGETYALVARLGVVRLLLAHACVTDFKLYQLDVKSLFLNGYIEE